MRLEGAACIVLVAGLLPVGSGNPLEVLKSEE